jgi:GMP synthase-like glutamine amidotransferase
MTAPKPRIGILETGAPPADLRAKFGSYAEMFEHLLGDDFDYQVFDVQAGQWPGRPEDFDGFVVTGSAAGVYEDDAWIGELMDWLRAAKGRTRLVGVCFGHQAMAQAFGGRVIKSPKGWGVGLQTYEVKTPEPWMTPVAPAFTIPASHQDQVVDLPPHAHVFAGDAFAPMAAIAYDDQPAISFQGHPEFDPGFATALIESRREEKLTDAEASRAVESLRRPDDRQQVGAWMRAFLAGKG